MVRTLFLLFGLQLLESSVSWRSRQLNGDCTLTKSTGGFQTYCCDGFKSSPKGAISSLDLIGTDGKETNGGKLNAGKFAGLTAACTAGATVAATAAGEYMPLSQCLNYLLN